MNDSVLSLLVGVAIGVSVVLPWRDRTKRRLLAVLRNMVDGSPCAYSARGNCTSHGAPRPCPQELANQAIREFA